MSDIKECFISRFEDGVVLEADFSQLEVIGLAALSRDPVLIEDLLSGRDMHTYYTAKRLHIEEAEVKSKDRRATKRMTFQLQYGSGAENMAKKIGVTKTEAEDFIGAYYERYAGVKAWQEENIQAVKRSRTPSAKRSKKDLPLGRGELHSPSGRIYAFYETDPPPWSKTGQPTFMPTEIKNYPVQGFATGDIMALFRARVHRWWLDQEDREFYLPINTVHDSILFDAFNMEYARKVAEALEAMAEALQEEIESLWGINCPVPFKIESKAGPNWATMEKL